MHRNINPMKKITLALCFLWISSAWATTPVALAPVAKQFFVNTTNGNPLAFGCVFSYHSGSTTPLATYSDALGISQNTNPIILTAAGFPGASGSSSIYLLSGQSYTIKVVSAGGVNCASGSTQYTIDSVGGGNALTTVALTCTGTCASVISAQIQLFQVTLTGNTTADPISAVGISPPAVIYYELIQDSGGAHTWVWPSNSRGGCTISGTANNTTVQAFEWNGSVLEAVGPCVTGNGPDISAAILRLSGQLISTLPTGTAPFVIASTTQVANLNVSALEGFTWESPGTIGSTTPNTGKFTTLNATTSLQLNGGTVQTAVQGTDTHLQTAGTVSANSPTVCIDANGGITTTCTTTGPIFAPQSASTAGLPVSLTANTQATVLSKVVTFPSAAGTYRADLRSGIWVTTGPNACATEIIDVTNNVAYASVNSQNANGSGFIGLTGAQITSATYAAGASVTFHLDVLCNANSTATLKWALVTGTLSPNPSSFLDITPLLSN